MNIILRLLTDLLFGVWAISSFLQSLEKTPDASSADNASNSRQQDDAAAETTPPSPDSVMIQGHEVPYGEKTMQGVLLLGMADGVQFAQKYGRPPGIDEFDALVTKDLMAPETVESGTPRAVEFKRNLVDTFRKGFELGCKRELEGQQPAF